MTRSGCGIEVLLCSRSLRSLDFEYDRFAVEATKAGRFRGRRSKTRFAPGNSIVPLRGGSHTQVSGVGDALPHSGQMEVFESPERL